MSIRDRRRLSTQGGVDTVGIDELVAICKGDNPAVPLEAAHLRNANRDQGEVYLRQVHGVRHVNALAPDQRLTLHRVGPVPYTHLTLPTSALG